MALESQLLVRSMGLLSQPAFHSWYSKSLIDSLVPAPHITFDGSNKIGHEANIWAHRTGINAIASDRFEGQL